MKKPLFAVLLILSSGILSYSNSFQVPFVFDDQPSIVDNPVIRSLDNFLASTSGYEYQERRFVGYLTFALNYGLGGLDVTGYHVFNLLIHLANALLLYALVRLTFRTPHLAGSRLAPRAGTVALACGLLFSVHPVQTQAVTYVVQRLTSLATLFYLLAVVLYAVGRLRVEEGGGWRRGLPWLAGSVLSAVLGMKTKEIVFTLPFAVLLYEASFFRGGWKRRLLYLLPLLLTAVMVPLSVLGAGDSAGDLLSDVSERLRGETRISRWDYLFTQFRVIVTYLRLLVFPIRQNLDYDYPIHTAFFTWPVFLSFLLLISLFGLAIHLYGFKFISRSSTRTADPATRLISFGILWFFLGLSVESSLVPITDVIFEHRVYLPSAGAFTAGVVAIGMMVLRGDRPVLARVFPVLVAGAVLSLVIMTWSRNEVWKSPVTLWQNVAVQSPNKARPQFNLGVSLQNEGRARESIGFFSEAIRIEPGHFKARNNLAVALKDQGRIHEAIEILYTGVGIQPENPEAFINLGAALAVTGRLNEAVKILYEAVRLQPGNTDALNNLGIVLTNAGNLEEAISILKETVRIQPDHAKAHFNLGRALLQAGRHAEAEEEFRHTIRIDPGYGNALVSLAEVLNQGRRFQEAAILLEQNLGRLGERADARFNLGVAYAYLGNREAARRELAAVTRLDASLAESLARLLR